ncbi:MAG: hypothetical protein RIQ69_410 [Pseudomonadota bacterium]|jgi:hypothetical protein
MKSSPLNPHQTYMQVDDAFDAASKLIAKNFTVCEELQGTAMILSGLLTLAFMLEREDESQNQ